MKLGVYNAGPLFTEGEWTQRKLEGKLLREKLNKDLIVNNPADYPINDDASGRTNAMIFEYDTNTILKSGFGIFDLDPYDPGTKMEFGMMVMEALEHDDVYIIAKLTDFRAGLDVKMNEIPGYALNGFMSGAFQYPKLLNAKPIPQIYVVNSNEEAIETVNAIYDVIKNNKQVDAKEFYEKYSKGMTAWSKRDRFPK